MKICDVTRESYGKEVEEYKGTVLLDFFADWCTPCKSFAPVIEEAANTSGNKVKICKVNVDSEKELTERFGIRSIPALIVVKNGSVINRSVCITSKKAIIDMLE